MKRVGTASLTMLLVLGAAACGDDDDAEDAAVSADAYCAASAALDEQDDLPSDDQMDELADLAPDEIGDEVTLVVDAFKEDGPAAFGDADVEEAFEAIDEFEIAECGREAEDAAEGTSSEIDPDAQRVDVAATEYDFAFDAPEAGAVSFVMTNEGEEPHFMFIGRLLGDATLDEALQSEDPTEEGLAEDVGESDTVGPGEEAVLTIEDLPSGRYAMLCFIPTSDGTPHAFEGMAVEFAVD